MGSARRSSRDGLPPRTEPYTFREFCELVPEGEKADLINGVIHVASPDNLDAGNLNLWLAMLMYDYVESRDLGRLFGWRIAFRLSNTHSPEPDLAFVLKTRLHLMRKGFFQGP